MANSVADELRKAFDHVGLRVDLVHIGYRVSSDGRCPLQQYSFWVIDDYRFQGHNPGQGWRRVKDENPEDGTEVLVWPRDRLSVTAIHDKDAGYLPIGPSRPTHWMPLPAGPEEKS